MKTKFATLIFLMIFLSVISIQNVYAVYCSDQGVLAIWNFDEGNGMNITDKCYSHFGQFYGSPIWVMGKSGYAIEFNGTTDYLDLSPNFNDTYPEFSFSFWTNFTPNNVYFTEAFLQKGEYSSGSFIDINYDNGNNNFINLGTDYGGSSNFLSQTIQDGNYHNIIGIYNGNVGYTEIYVDGVFIANSTAVISSLLPSTYPFFIGLNYANGWLLNGSIDELIIYNKSLSYAEVQNIYVNYSCSNVLNPTLSLISYPYVDFNTTYIMKLSSFPVGDSNIQIQITDPDNVIQVFNMTYDGISSYQSIFIFDKVGDYNYVIYSGDNLCPTIISNITGQLKVRIPYYVTVQAFINKSTNIFTSNRYKNDFAYVLAEPTSFLRKDDYRIYLTPISYPVKPVFYAQYNDGIAILKLFEPNQSYNFRLIDGQIYFPSQFSVPNITKLYGTNIYFGQATLNGTNVTLNILLQDKDIHPYRYLFNFMFIVGMIFTVILGIMLLFIFPTTPLLSLIVGIGFPIMFIILRIVVWWWWY